MKNGQILYEKFSCEKWKMKMIIIKVAKNILRKITEPVAAYLGLELKFLNESITSFAGPKWPNWNLVLIYKKINKILQYIFNFWASIIVLIIFPSINTHTRSMFIIN